MTHGVYGQNDRRICPDCDTVCPETARVCPGCGRKFKMIYAPTLGRGYAIPLLIVSPVIIGYVGACLALSPELMQYLLLLPLPFCLLLFLGVCRYARSNWQGVGLAPRLLAALAVIVMLAALAFMLEGMGFGVYWMQMQWKGSGG